MHEQEHFVRPVDIMRLYKQKHEWSCGPASLIIAFSAFSLHIYEKDILKDLDLHDGADWKDFRAYSKEYFLKTQFVKNASWEQMSAFHHRHASPIIIGWNSDRETAKGFHFSVVKHIDSTNIALLDPAFGDQITYTHDHFTSLWYDEQSKHTFLGIYR